VVQAASQAIGNLLTNKSTTSVVQAGSQALGNDKKAATVQRAFEVEDTRDTNEDEQDSADEIRM
jgi:hypothetical protein